MKTTALIAVMGMISAFDASAALNQSLLSLAVHVRVFRRPAIQPVEEGSGFFVQNGTNFFFVTARHILFSPGAAGALNGSFASLVCGNSVENARPNLFAYDLDTLSAARNIGTNKSRDIAVIRFAHLGGDGSMVFYPGAQQVHHGMFNVINSNGLGKFADVGVANSAYLFGYPSSLGIELDDLRPLVRHGIIAGKYKSQKQIVTDCPAFPGNSGGPVVEQNRPEDEGHVIGIVVGIVPYNGTENSGYSIVEPSDFILETMAPFANKDK